MKQKIEDLKLLLKNDKRIMAAAAFVVIALILWIMTADQGGKQRVRMPKDTGAASQQGMGAEEQYGDLLVAFRNEIETGKRERAEMVDQLSRTSEDLKTHKNQVAGIFEQLVDKFDALARDVDQLASALQQKNSEVPVENRPTIEGPDELVPEWFDEKEAAPRPPEPQPLRVSVIAPGDSVPLQLLTGVTAPTDGTPYPVVFKLTGPISGPDGTSLDIGEARLIAAAQGSESDSRAVFRLTQLSITHPNGRRAVIDVDGWVVGEDGIRGMKGKLEDKLGRLILATAVISGVAALGEQLEDNSTVVLDDDNNSTSGFAVNQNDFEYAAASAVTDASNRLGQVLLRRYEALVPVVEVLSGREVVAIFSSPAEISILDDELVQSASYGGGIE